ncbi:trans-aconitate 2-methyltransferase [Legionella pneumophila]|uniref:GNAT family N-acetyltransferase n=1 Tax=Legionella pneumophila TaxID=446 RepID=UPI00077076B1|nr:GNAT family N-acetyltransferase [Legionella pneumophila]CZG38655.1 trans-aconitate 2-methyltransferase [Legionella pneumophila]CZH39963.1 trans-aconitate 2-methyltransferase [Legionella pneumophila]
MKNIEYHIENNPSSQDDQIVIQGITDYNNSIHNDPVSHHSIYAKSNDDIIGGALIYQHSDAVYIDTLWVKEDYRRQGIATELLKRVEQDALEKGIVKQIICTISPQARDLYQKLGFQLIATVPEYLLGLDKFYLKKIADKSSVKEVYNKLVDWFDDARTKTLAMENKYLKLIVDTIPKSGSILDVGCGSGEPLSKYFIDKRYPLIGVDNSEAMIELCRQRFPNHKWILMDMRSLQLEQQFDCVIAWHSFFHIPKEEQKAVLVNMIAHVAEKGLLVFTSGVEHGEVWSNNGGEMLFHASLSTEEYQQILQANKMNVLQHNVSDPDCGGATVWVAQKS